MKRRLKQEQKAKEKELKEQATKAAQPASAKPVDTTEAEENIDPNVYIEKLLFYHKT